MLLALWTKWIPWRYAIRRLARAQGFIDPIAVLSRFHRLQQPSEVAEPLELLRAGVVFHARGLLNTKVIQHNLDWIWPYWVERQFDPESSSFIPRAFSITHVNLTHRNWTAVGLPDCDSYAIVDPRGLVMPHWDSWSVDVWMQNGSREMLIPSKLQTAEQRLTCDGNLHVITECALSDMQLRTDVSMEMSGDNRVVNLAIDARSASGGNVFVVLRPYNGEGVSFIETIQSIPQDGDAVWHVDGEPGVFFSEAPQRQLFSKYKAGDVYSLIQHREPSEGLREITCDVGLATAAAVYPFGSDTALNLSVRLPIKPASKLPKPLSTAPADEQWRNAVRGTCELAIPDQRMQAIWDAAIRVLILLSPHETYPGPYTYKRFWFRDAAFMVHSLLLANLVERAEGVLSTFRKHQQSNGYFLSQEGEWDSNGQVLWILQRYAELTGKQPDAGWQNSLARGADWIARKRTSDSLDAPHAGLLPAGFSAEHLGPNDYYYWDDFWAVAGLRSAAALFAQSGDRERAERYSAEADAMLSAIERSFTQLRDRVETEGIPASPYRRMDAGAIGSIACGYPLELYAAKDKRLLATIESILKHFFVQGTFFQDMIHSGMNAYLTLQVAQILLRAEDPRYFELIESVAKIASPTGQWPEANHPITLGGCMGDGQHGWACAEWVAMLRNCFVREAEDTLIVASGIPEAWLEQPGELRCGPTPTKFGPVTVTIEVGTGEPNVRVEGAWFAGVPKIEVRLARGKSPVRQVNGSAAMLERKI